MRKTALGYEHTIHFETVTPVAVLDGNSLSPLSDYTVDTQNPYEAWLLNHQKFEAWLREDKDAMDSYLKKVNEQKGNKTNHFLFDFIHEHNSHKETREFFRKKRNISGNDQNTVELKTCIKDAGRPYIPGSTLKGAFKSVWMFNWLSENGNKIDKISDIIKKTRDHNKKASNYAQKEIDNIINDNLDNRISNKRRMLFSTFQVGDAYCDTFLNWYHCKRFHIRAENEKSKSVPLFIEAIAPESKGSFVINLESNQVVNPDIEKFKTLKAASLQEFFKQINDYALANIAHEIAMTENEKLSGYKSFLTKIKDEIEQTDDKSAYLPVGFGKSNFYQSIGLLLRQKDKKVFEKYIRLFQMGKRPDKYRDESYQKELPLTRNLTFENQLPLGWIRISDQAEV